MVIDGHSLAFRAFYALPVDSFVNRDGQHTNAIHGFISMLLMLLQREKPTHLAVAFDISRFSFRTREYAEYKGTRSETPAEFKGQIPLLQQALEAMGITTVTKEDYEADDILATLSSQGAEQGFQVFVVSGDRDAIQLVNDDVTLLYPSVRGVSELTRYDRDKVYERYGIEPHQYPDVAALVGETSDNLIGVDKVGEKTAVKWVTQYGSLDGVLEHADEIKGVVGNNLREQRDRAIRNRRLNRLVTDVELPVGPADVALRPLDEAAVRELFATLQFRTLLDRVFKVAGTGEPSDQTTEEGGIEDAGVTPPPVKTLIDEELGYWLERKNAADSENGYGVAVEVIDGRLSAIGIATHDDAVLVPGGSGAKDYEQLTAWFASDAPKHFHDAKAAIKALGTAGIAVNGVAADARIMGWLANPGKQGQPLTDLVYQELGEELPSADANRPGERRRARLVRPPGDHGAPCPDRPRFARGARRHRAAPGVGARADGDHRCRHRPTGAHRAVEGARGTRRRPRAAGLRGDRPRGQPRVAEAAAGGPVHRARDAEDPEDQDGLLDRRRQPDRPAGAAPAPVPRPAAAAP
jgi:DNA polymerase-1